MIKKHRAYCKNEKIVEVGEHGEIVITGKEHDLKLTFNPIMDSGKLRWSCHGVPDAAVTKLCKP